MTAVNISKEKPKVAEERRERFFILLLLSLLIHAVLILLLAIFFATRPGETSQKAAVPAEPPPPEVTFEIPPPSPPERPFVEAHQPTDKTPKNAPFQSDQNTAAASELPAQGSAPLPTQQGINRPSLDLENQRYTPGEHASTSAGNPTHPQPPTQPSHPAPSPLPSTQASPPPREEQSKQQPHPTPVPTAGGSATPQPTPPIPPPPNSVRLLPLPGEQLPQRPTPQPSTSRATAAQNPPQTAAPAVTTGAPGTSGPQRGYQPETQKTVIRGNISNRGHSSFAAEATPIGRYKKQIADAIGSRWYYYVNERMGLISIGTVSVTFKVTASGKVTGLRVVSNNSNESLTDCSLRSIMDATFPPIPPDVAATLQNGSLEIDFSFTIY